MNSFGDGHAQLEAKILLEDCKFCSAHFLASPGFRETLHGHSFTASVSVGGPEVKADGYLVDFRALKNALRRACKRLDQKTLLPLNSEVLQLQQTSGPSPQVDITCEDGSRFSLPASDCVLLPVANTTAEELARYLWSDILETEGLGEVFLQRGNAEWLEVGVAERPGQESRYRSGVAHRPLARAGGEAGREEQPLPTKEPVQLLELPKLLGSGVSNRLSVVDTGKGKDANGSKEDSAGQTEQVCLPCGPATTQLLPFNASALAEATAVEDPAVTAWRVLIDMLGEEEAGRDELKKTPARAAKAWRELNAACFAGDPKEAVGEGIFDDPDAEDLVVVRDIQFQSLCEHHLLPFWGTAHVAYLPNGRILGLSKFARLLTALARRPNVQERLTRRFAETLEELLGTRGVLVVVEGRHSCMSLRGAMATSAQTRTMAFRGALKDDRAIRKDLLDGIGVSNTSL
jgi:GTP cyclohydrolase I